MDVGFKVSGLGGLAVQIFGCVGDVVGKGPAGFRQLLLVPCAARRSSRLVYRVVGSLVFSEVVTLQLPLRLLLLLLVPLLVTC